MILQGRRPGGILTRCPNHLCSHLSMQRNSDSTLSPSHMSEFLTWWRLSPATVEETHFCHLHHTWNKILHVTQINDLILNTKGSNRVWKVWVNVFFLNSLTFVSLINSLFSISLLCFGWYTHTHTAGNTMTLSHSFESWLNVIFKAACLWKKGWGVMVLLKLHC